MATRLSIGALVKSGAIRAIQDGNHGEKHPKSSDFVEDGIPFVMSRNLTEGRLDLDSCEHISPEQARSLRVGFSKSGDVLLTHKGTLGEVAIVPLVDPYIVLTPQVTYYRTDPSQLLGGYLKYAFQHPSFRDQMAAIGNQSTRPFVSITAQRYLEIFVPPPPTQRKIAAILSAYDELIENNNRRIETLEEMARRIYHEWFVEFRFPGHEGRPLEVPSEIGPVPQGWSVVRMDKVADVVDCLHSKKPVASPVGSDLLLQVFNIGAYGLLDLRKPFRVSGSDYRQWTSRIELKAGDCVVTNVGRIAAVAQIPTGLRAAPGRNMTAIRPRVIPPTYLIQYLLSDHMTREVDRKKDAGSIMDALNVKGIVRLAVPVPEPGLLGRFEELARPIRRQMELLIEIQARLQESRDLILPRVISGEVDVSALDIAVPASAA